MTGKQEARSVPLMRSAEEETINLELMFTTNNFDSEIIRLKYCDYICEVEAMQIKNLVSRLMQKNH